MNDYELKEIRNSHLIDILIASIIPAFLMLLLHNVNIDPYFKNFILPATLLILSFLYIVSRTKWKINKKSYFYLVPIILILISNLILKIDESNRILNILILPLLISIFFFSLINPYYQLSRHVFFYLWKLFPNGLFENFSYLENLKRKETNSNRKLTSILIGSCIGIPLAFLILSLLKSADKYFAVFMNSLLSSFQFHFNMNFLLTNLILFLSVFILFYVILVNLFRYQDQKMKESTYHKANSIVAITILTILNSVFFLFLVSELSKITTNFLQVPIQYTYSNYAREGFFQLLFITLINFSFLLYYIYETNSSLKNKWLKRLLSLLIVFSILLIGSSYYRMFLYLMEYGFTILRLQVIFFLTMELILFLILTKKIRVGLKYRDAYLFTGIIITTYLINLYFCHQPLIDFLNQIGHQLQ